jgi:hypothetical protein
MDVADGVRELVAKLGQETFRAEIADVPRISDQRNPRCAPPKRTMSMLKRVPIDLDRSRANHHRHPPT